MAWRPLAFLVVKLSVAQPFAFGLALRLTPEPGDFDEARVPRTAAPTSRVLIPVIFFGFALGDQNAIEHL